MIAGAFRSLEDRIGNLPSDGADSERAAVASLARELFSNEWVGALLATEEREHWEHACDLTRDLALKTADSHLEAAVLGAKWRSGTSRLQERQRLATLIAESPPIPADSSHCLLYNEFLETARHVPEHVENLLRTVLRGQGCALIEAQSKVYDSLAALRAPLKAGTVVPQGTFELKSADALPKSYPGNPGPKTDPGG